MAKQEIVKEHLEALSEEEIEALKWAAGCSMPLRAPCLASLYCQRRMVIPLLDEFGPPMLRVITSPRAPA